MDVSVCNLQQMKLYMTEGKSDISVTSFQQKENADRESLNRKRSFVECTNIVRSSLEHFGLIGKKDIISPKDLYKKFLADICCIEDEQNDAELSTMITFLDKMNYLIDKFALKNLF